MKNKDNFVRKCAVGPKNLDGQIEYYNEVNNKINDCLEKKKEYEEEINKEEKSTNKNLSFKEQLELYLVIIDLIKKEKENYYNIDLVELKKRLEIIFDKINDYKKLNASLNFLYENKNKILFENISFNNNSLDSLDNPCPENHLLIRLNDELKCLHCSFSTKDYKLTKEELDFLTKSALKKKILVQDRTKENLIFYECKNISEEQDSEIVTIRKR